MAELRERVATSEGLAADDLQETIPSGKSRFSIPVGWALPHLSDAGLLERTRRGILRLTPESDRVLSQAPSHIDKKVLRGIPSYAGRKKRQRSSSSDKTTAHWETIRVRDRCDIQRLDRSYFDQEPT